jgi:predicted RNA-binding protein YlqC (UPF0109 family)
MLILANNHPLATMIAQLVETIVRHIVEHQDSISINVVEGSTVIIVELKVHKDDLGKVIGKEGNMAWAIRTILSNAATRMKKKAILQIVE